MPTSHSLSAPGLREGEEIEVEEDVWIWNVYYDDVASVGADRISTVLFRVYAHLAQLVSALG